MKQLSTFFVFIIFSLPLAAQTLDRVQIEKMLDSTFKSINNSNSPGVAISVLQNGKRMVSKAYGMANLEHKASFTHNSPVRLGYSGTREFMCVGLALMEAEGLLRFDDKVKKYFPKLPAWSEGARYPDPVNERG